MSDYMTGRTLDLDRAITHLDEQIIKLPYGMPRIPNAHTKKGLEQRKVLLLDRRHEINQIHTRMEKVASVYFTIKKNAFPYEEFSLEVSRIRLINIISELLLKINNIETTEPWKKLGL